MRCRPARSRCRRPWPGAARTRRSRGPSTSARRPSRRTSRTSSPSCTWRTAHRRPSTVFKSGLYLWTKRWNSPSRTADAASIRLTRGPAPAYPAAVSFRPTRLFAGCRPEVAAGPDGRILAVGAAAREAAGADAEVEELPGRTLPGLADAHIHLESLARLKLEVDLA